MASYTLVGLKITFGSGGATAVEAASLNIVFAGNDTSLSYVLNGTSNGGLPGVTVTGPDLVGVMTPDGQNLILNEASAASITSNGQTVQVFTLDVGDDSYVFTLSGLDLTSLVLGSGNPLATFNAINAGITAIGPITSGPFQPGVDVDLTGALAFDSSSQNDALRLLGSEGKINLGQGSDTVMGSEANDNIKGGGGQDFIGGARGNDKISGGGGNDGLLGGKGKDKISGGGGGDSIAGEAGNDTIKGGGGKDLISGGAGNDLLIGNKGGDMFLFYTGEGKDRIKDFGGKDKLYLSVDFLGEGMTSVEDLLEAYATKSGGNITLDFEDGTRITLEDFTNMSKLANVIELFTE